MAWGTSEPQKPRAPEGSSSGQGFPSSSPFLISLRERSGPATLPGTAAWEPGGCSGVVACIWVCWAAGDGGGRTIWWVQDRGGPASAAPISGSRWGGGHACAAQKALPSPHLRRWFLEGWRLHDFGRPVAVVLLLLLGQLLLHQVNVTAGGDGG